MMIAITLIAAFAMGGAAVASWIVYRRSIDMHKDKTLIGASELALAEIDADKIDDWINNGADDKYEETNTRLQRIVDNTPDLKSIYLLQPLRQNGYVSVFDLQNSKDEYQYDRYGLGENVSYLMTLDENLETLRNGNAVDPTPVTLNINGHTEFVQSHFAPVFDSEGKLAAILGVDIDLNSDFNKDFATGLLVVSLVLLVFFVISGTLLFRRARRADENDEKEHVQSHSKTILRELIEAFARAVDLKDEYTQGHSTRVAEYSVKIAQELGKSEEECEQIYYAGLLHDIGKILIPSKIINKPGKLTNDEYAQMKTHSTNGYKILSSITDFPYLSLGAHYHHERYDGGGYPDHLKGNDIPEIARIIAVADAYDAMSSNRSYRDAIPQDLVREEIVKGAGLQFDPVFAKVMQHLIDIDTEYQMKERAAINAFGGDNEIRCYEYRSRITEGIPVTRQKATIHLEADYTRKGSVDNKAPSIVLFDCLDGHVQTDKQAIRALYYYEYCEIRLDGQTKNTNARDIKVEYKPHEIRRPGTKSEVIYDIETARFKDHLFMKIDDGFRFIEVTVALPDSTRFAYAGITGEYCHIHDISIDRDEEEITADYITRIADPISYIDGPSGDIPNLQIDGYRTEASDGIPIEGKFTISFHTMSLPISRLIWHCPYFVIFTSDDGKVHGQNYKELSLIRLDGENWESEGLADNDLTVNKHDDFEGWNKWKELNKQGYDSEITFERGEKEITATTFNHGIYIRNITGNIKKDQTVYVALSGDEVALTNIRIRKED